MPITKATASSVAPAAKGDLVVGSATNDAAVLGVGANDTVLTADSSTATGLKWAAASAGGGWTLLSTTTLSGTSTSITSINQNYKNLHFVIRSYGNSPGAKIRIRPNSDTSSTSNTVYSADQVDAITNWESNGANIGTGNGGAIYGVIYDYASAFRHPLFMHGISAADGQGSGFIAHGSNDTATAITSLLITTQAGTSTLSGTFLLYGEN
jgi:hypothetical protein